MKKNIEKIMPIIGEIKNSWTENNKNDDQVARDGFACFGILNDETAAHSVVATAIVGDERSLEVSLQILMKADPRFCEIILRAALEHLRREENPQLPESQAMEKLLQSPNQEMQEKMMKKFFGEGT